MKLIFENWRRFLNEQELRPSKQFWDTGETYHPGTKTIKTKKVPYEWDVVTDEDEPDIFVSPDSPWAEETDVQYPPPDLDPEDVTEWGEEFIQTEPMVFTGRAKKPDEFYTPPPPPGHGPESAKPSRFLRNLIPFGLQQFQDERNEIYNFYKTGANRTPFVGPNGLIRTHVPGFDERTPQKFIDDYYKKEILPELERIIYNTPVGSDVGLDALMGTAAYYLPKNKKMYRVFPYMASDTFKHELGHAIDWQLAAALEKRGFLPDIPYKWTMGQQQDKVLNKIFPHLPLRSRETFEDEPTYETHGHHGARGEIYTSIITTREKQGRLFKADDIKRMRAWYGLPMSVLKGMKGDVDYDLIRAVNEYGNENLTDQEIADLLNQVAKADVPTKQTNRGYA